VLDQALSYIAKGIPIFPLIPGEKRPATPNGFKDATTEQAQIEAWWKAEPDANIGIPTGVLSGLTIVDFDFDKGGDEWSKLYSPELPGFRVKTPHGSHYYFAYTPELRQTTGLMPGVDVRNDGGYVVAPGSVVDGKLYEVEHRADLTPVPEALLRLQEARVGTAKTPIPSEDGEVGEGARNAFLASVAGALRRQAVGKGGIEEALLVINQESCSPPLEDTEVLTIARSMCRYNPDPDEVEVPEPPCSVIVKATELVPATLKYLLDKERVVGEPTGIVGLDELIGGRREGEITAIHATAKTGKSTVLHQIIKNDLDRGVPVGYASREMYPDTEVLPLLLSNKLDRDMYVTENVKETEVEGVVSKWPLYFPYGYGQFPWPEATDWMTELNQKYGVQQFFFDHLHYMAEKEDWQDVAKLIREIKRTTMRLKVHSFMVIQPPQLNEGQELGLRTLRGGAGVGQAINTLLVLERLRDTPSVMKLSVKDARSKLVKQGSLYLEYSRKTTRLREVTPQEVETPKDRESTSRDPSQDRYPTSGPKVNWEDWGIS
jgi:RecA/RadA recombinase